MKKPHNLEGGAHNNAIWSASLKEYVKITRICLDGQRIEVRTESENFIRWTEPINQIFLSYGRVI